MARLKPCYAYNSNGGGHSFPKASPPQLHHPLPASLIHLTPHTETNKKKIFHIAKEKRGSESTGSVFVKDRMFTHM